MNVLTEQTIICDTFIIVSQTRVFGHIIESNTQDVRDNIFDVYDVSLSEVEYIKRKALEGRDAFAALTATGDVLVFSRIKRSSYIMGVIRISIECMKYIMTVFPFVNTSPTLTRKLRRCHHDGEFKYVCGVLSLFYGIDICEYRLGEFIYTYILEYSSAYGCDVNIQSVKVRGINPVGAVMCEDMLHLYLHYLFITVRKQGVGKIEVRIDEISDRAVIHSRLFVGENEALYAQKLSDLSQIADALSVSIKYKLCDGIAHISLCPYFTDDGQQGLKSKISFDF